MSKNWVVFDSVNVFRKRSNYVCLNMDNIIGISEYRNFFMIYTNQYEMKFKILNNERNRELLEYYLGEF